MPKETPHPHTPGTIEDVAINLEKMAAEIREALVVMRVTPPLATVVVPRENSLKVGEAGMRSWVDALRDAVASGRREALRNGDTGVPSAPATGGNPVKPSKKK